MTQRTSNSRRGLSRLRDRPQLRLRANKLPSPNHCESRDFLLVNKNLSLTRKVHRCSTSPTSQGCPGGIIADEPAEHSLVAEFGMYYKSPEIAPLAQPANPLEATTGEATTGAGAPTGGAPPEPHRSQTQ